MTATESGLMMPALLPAISVSVSPRYSVWSMPIGVITATAASATLVESQVPPSPTSTTADVDRGVARTPRYAMAVRISNLDSGSPPVPPDAASTRSTYGATSV